METEIIKGLMDALSFANILYVAIGVIIGIIVGCIPGLSGPIAIAMLIPLTYFMPTVGAIGFLVGINKGGCFGGSITSILLNTPGAPEAAATCFDGYPLAQKGQGGKALKVSLYSSCFGDLFSTLLVICVAGYLASVAMKLGPTEMLAILTLALTLIAALESENFVIGIISACLGLLFATIGMEPVAALPRFTFGLYQLESGIPIATLCIGFLAIVEVLRQAARLKEEADSPTAGKLIKMSHGGSENRLSLLEIISLIPTWIRSALVGSGIGACPGLGSTVACFLSYGIAKKNAKQGERFGEGELKGVAAPETANNAVVGAALIPLFTLGIPGSVAASILVGAFVVHGITPGPLMFEEHARSVYGIYGSMIIGNLATLLFGLASIRMFVKVLDIPKQVLFPVIMFTCFMGAYVTESDAFYVNVMLFFAVLGLLFRIANFSYVSFIIGFVLGGMFETSLQQMLIMSQGQLSIMFTRPIALFINCITILFVLWTCYSALRDKRNAARAAAAA